VRPRDGRRRVLHVAPVLWSGAGEAITSLCEFQSTSNEVAILTSARQGIERDWPAYRARLSRAGVAHARVETLSRDPEEFWNATGLVSEILGAWKPSIVHTHAGVPACVVAHAAAAVRRSVRHVAHMYSWNPERPEWMNTMDAWGFSRADVTICSARDYAGLLRAYGVQSRRIVVIPWGVRFGAGFPAPADPPGDARPYLGFVGRAEPRKGQLELVEAVGRLRARWPALRLDLVGPDAVPEYAGRVRDAIRSLGLEANVRLHGYVKDVRALRATWSLFVSLSTDEGQGLAVQEAMADGLPVLALDAPGLRDYLVHGRTAMLIASRRPPVVASAIDRALSSPARLAGIARRGRTMVRRRFDWRRCLAAIESAYRER
jgi:glycosyltransferase involved in cell wall biosynthesis